MSDTHQVFDTPNSIGMFRLSVLKKRCEIEVHYKAPMSINTCAAVRKEFHVPGRSRQGVVDFLSQYIKKIEDEKLTIDVYGHIVDPTTTPPKAA